ncbi:MAG TPA: AI-2E family transporter [Gemmatimonadales bacterium]|nr:AI-2E family transporter [Gemmatimonadales bacterium]
MSDIPPASAPSSTQSLAQLRTALAGINWRAAVVLVAVLVAAAILVWALRLLARPLALLLLAITLAQALAPVVTWLERWMSRAAAAALVYVALLVIAGLIGWLLIPRLVNQGQQLVHDVPSWFDQARAWLERWQAGAGEQVRTTLRSEGGKLAGLILSVPQRVLSGLAELLLLAFLSFYWLVSQPSLTEFALSLVPAERRPGTGRVLRDMGRAMGGYVRGVVIDAAIMGTLAGVGLLIINFEYPIVAALLTMLGELLPVIGPVVAGAIVVVLALFHGIHQALLALAIYVGLELLEGHLLTPNIMRSQTQVPQVLVLFALFAGASLGGIVGALAAIPLAAALHVLANEAAAPAVRRRTGAAG